MALTASPAGTRLRVAITIATRNRLADLKRTLAVVAALEPAPDELLITADGCSDGTPEFVREHFPLARLTVNGVARGSTASRDAMFRAAESDLIVILDDDSYPLDSDFLSRTPAFFEKHPRLAVLSFSQRSDETPVSLTTADFGATHLAGTYVDCAAMLRKSVFIELGGYPAQFRIAYDEPDFSVRCVCAGWQIRYEPSLTFRHHYSSAQRSELRMHQTHARNEIWSVIMRCPAPQLFMVAAFRAARQFTYACRRGFGWALREPQWWLACVAGVPRCLAERHPLPWRKYRDWMHLVRVPIHDETEWLSKFGGGPR